jgi:hypothetical protein
VPPLEESGDKRWVACHNPNEQVDP